MTKYPTSKDKDIIDRALSRCNVDKALAIAVVQLFFASPNPRWWKYKAWGAAVFCRDKNRAYMLRIVNVDNGRILWEHEFYSDWKYSKDDNTFHTFLTQSEVSNRPNVDNSNGDQRKAAKQWVAGISFSNEERAERFLYRLTQKQPYFRSKAEAEIFKDKSSVFEFLESKGLDPEAQGIVKELMRLGTNPNELKLYANTIVEYVKNNQPNLPEEDEVSEPPVTSSSQNEPEPVLSPTVSMPEPQQQQGKGGLILHPARMIKPVETNPITPYQTNPIKPDEPRPLENTDITPPPRPNRQSNSDNLQPPPRRDRIVPKTEEPSQVDMPPPVLPEPKTNVDYTPAPVPQHLPMPAPLSPMTPITPSIKDSIHPSSQVEEDYYPAESSQHLNEDEHPSAVYNQSSPVQQPVNSFHDERPVLDNGKFHVNSAREFVPGPLPSPPPLPPVEPYEQENFSTPHNQSLPMPTPDEELVTEDREPRMQMPEVRPVMSNRGPPINSARMLVPPPQAPPPQVLPPQAPPPQAPPPQAPPPQVPPPQLPPPQAPPVESYEQENFSTPHNQGLPMPMPEPRQESEPFMQIPDEEPVMNSPEPSMQVLDESPVIDNRRGPPINSARMLVPPPPLAPTAEVYEDPHFPTPHNQESFMQTPDERAMTNNYYDSEEETSDEEPIVDIRRGPPINPARALAPTAPVAEPFEPVHFPSPQNQNPSLQMPNERPMMDSHGPPINPGRAGPGGPYEQGYPPFNQGPPMPRPNGSPMMDNRGPPMHSPRAGSSRPYEQGHPPFNQGPPMPWPNGSPTMNNRGSPMQPLRAGPTAPHEEGYPPFNQGPHMQMPDNGQMMDSRGPPMNPARSGPDGPYQQDQPPFNQGPPMHSPRAGPAGPNEQGYPPFNQGPPMNPARAGPDGPYQQDHPPFNQGPPMQWPNGNPMMDNHGPSMNPARAGPDGPYQQGYPPFNQGPPMQWPNGGPMMDNRGQAMHPPSLYNQYNEGPMGEFGGPRGNPPMGGLAIVVPDDDEPVIEYTGPKLNSARAAADALAPPPSPKLPRALPPPEFGLRMIPNEEFLLLSPFAIETEATPSIRKNPSAPSKSRSSKPYQTESLSDIDDDDDGDDLSQTASMRDFPSSSHGNSMKSIRGSGGRTAPKNHSKGKKRWSFSSSDSDRKPRQSSYSIKDAFSDELHHRPKFSDNHRKKFSDSDDGFSSSDESSFWDR